MGSGKIWFVTGAARGFGRLWVEAALARGDKVAATARNLSALDDLVGRYGTSLLPLKLDVTDRAGVFEAVNTAHRHFGRLDIILSNAGFGMMGAVEEVDIEDARAKMIHRGVRMLLVVDDMNHILGLITATDLTSEKPMQVVQNQGIRHSDVMVKDIMTPRERLEVLCMDDVQKACVGDVAATLKTHGRQHALVVDRGDDRGQTLRGMFSVSLLGKLLGARVETIAVARTFAEIGAELAR